MPLRLDGPEEVYRARHTLKDALSAQLALLDSFFPLQGWMVVQCRNNDLTMLSRHGSWARSVSSDVLTELMQGRWTANSDHPGFQYRILGKTEKNHFAGVLTAGSDSDCIFRRALRNPDGQLQAWLIGAASQSALAQIAEPGFPVDHVTRAVVGITLCITLHLDFERVTHQLTELQRSAFIEPLTRVLNRAGWMNRVQHLEAIVDRTEEDVAIVMLDLDLLKLVNDLDGHSAGDELLQLTARTIQSVVRRSDVVGRLGGDEFGVAVRGVTMALAQGLIKRLRVALDGVGVNVSIGMALKSESGTLDETFALADRRMYEEKRSKPVPERAMQWQRGSTASDVTVRP